MKKNKIGLLWEVVKDTKNKKACIIGPNSDDTPVIQRVVAKGKDFIQQPIPVSEMSYSEIEDNLKKDGYEIVDSYLLIQY